MAKQTIQLGTAPTGVGGYTPRSAFTKAQANFDEIYANFYQKTNTVGPVFQSGGVPTGAIIESGSNSSGSYTKFADGTMICIVRNAGPFSVGANALTVLGPFALPNSFISADFFCSAVTVPSGTNDAYGVVSAYAQSQTTFSFVHRNGASAQNVVGIKVFCLGR